MNPLTETSARPVPEIIVSYTPRFKKAELPLVRTAEEVYALFLSSWDQSKIEMTEQFKVMLVNRANRVLGICMLTSGSSTQCIVDIRTLFAIALKANAVGFIVAHNHPSQSLSPSTEDRDITWKIKEAARYLELRFMDHLIISLEAYYSFADEGEL